MRLNRHHQETNFSPSIVIIKLPYEPTYLSGIELGRKRAGLKELELRKRQMKLKHDPLEGVSISVNEQQRFDSIDNLVKYRPSKSREVAEKILKSDDYNYAKDFKYEKNELDQFNKKGKIFSYFYPDRESLEERYARERLADITLVPDNLSLPNRPLGGSRSSKSYPSLKGKDARLRDEWLDMKMTKELCDRHSQPVTKFSYPFIQFLCNDCYVELPDKSDVYALDELHLPVERLYATLIKYLDGGRAKQLEKYFMEYKHDFEDFYQEREKYCLEKELSIFRKAITEKKLELHDIWQRVEKMFKEYKLLKLFKDYETMILKYQEWAPACFDFKDKYLNQEYVWSSLNRLSDKTMQPIYRRSELCYICLSEPAVNTCNNPMNVKCKICKACSIYCKSHGYYCRLHEARYIKKCPICNIE
ncbi:unnamed protein product [Moneuplotes crassus]|uniref:Uncharacterized protein n=1 Tax=Euplotes crassus TaxID=5936 RepID=A0AAD1XG59_EUPCR|nr:unnamed protein product [Moneuplotes crassus]